MSRGNRRKQALRLKVIAMLEIWARHRCLHEAPAYWRRLVCPN